jgi:hypothetical protein
MFISTLIDWLKIGFLFTVLNFCLILRKCKSAKSYLYNSKFFCRTISHQIKLIGVKFPGILPVFRTFTIFDIKLLKCVYFGTGTSCKGQLEN